MAADRLSTAALIGYGAMAAPLQIMTIALIAFLPTFYATEMGLGLATVGLVFMAARAWDGVTDLVIGSLTDRTRTRIGRRLPWILAGVAPLVVAIHFLLIPGPARPGAGLGYLAFWLAVFYPFWTMIFIPHLSLTADLAHGYGERSRISSVREAGTVIGVVLALALPAWGLGREARLGQILEVIAYTSMLLFPLCALLMLATIKEPPPLPGVPLAWKNLWPIVRRNRPFQRLMLGYFASMLGIGVFVSLAFLTLSKGLLLGAAFLTLGVVQNSVALFTTPLWLRAAHRFGKHRAYCAAMALIGSGVLLLYLCPPGSYGVACAGFVVMGLGNLGHFAMPGAMLSDTVDYFTLKGGQEQAGQHVGLKSVVHKLSQTVSVGLGFFLLGLGGYQASGPNGEAAIAWLRAMAVAPTLLLFALAIGLMWNYPLDNRRQGIIRRRLERRSLAGRTL
jgi:Na+/melibiose symporter-like transporter